MSDYTILGAQSYSFRHFDTAGALDQLAKLDLSMIEFCGVHFPPDPDNIELPGIMALIKKRQATVPCYGVEGFGGDAAENRRKFEFASKLGAQYLSADPEPSSFAGLEELVDEFGIKIAIHNHGPGARYDKATDTLNAVKNLHPFIGACVDTGHIIRSGEAPHEVIERLGARVHCLHLKDWKNGGEETVIGEGDLDLLRTVASLRAINFDGFICMEFELDPEDPTPGMMRGMKNWIDAVNA
ncbi:MAG TPA: sugar phosphate isomerase/epimerase [Candidatus Hydrogenedentes bacterium]|nr:sugar phosphate isomerase/epimerase [Candidatus Hydrogenedentota bacterium]